MMKWLVLALFIASLLRNYQANDPPPVPPPPVLSKNVSRQFVCRDESIIYTCSSQSSSFLQWVAEPVVPQTGDTVMFDFETLTGQSITRGNIVMTRINSGEEPLAIEMIIRPDSNFINNSILCIDEFSQTADFLYTIIGQPEDIAVPTSLAYTVNTERHTPLVRLRWEASNSDSYRVECDPSCDSHSTTELTAEFELLSGPGIYLAKVVAIVCDVVSNPGAIIIDALTPCDCVPPTAGSQAPCVDRSVRVVGRALTEGRVEICDFGTWGTVCDRQWNNVDAMVVCRELGVPFSAAVARSMAFFGRGTGSILLNGVRCTGSEERLIDCPAAPFGMHDCGHQRDAGVSCQEYIDSAHNCELKLSRTYSNLLVCSREVVRFQCSSQSSTLLQWVAEPVVPRTGNDQVIFTTTPNGTDSVTRGNIVMTRRIIMPLTIEMTIMPDENFNSSLITCIDGSGRAATYLYELRLPGSIIAIPTDVTSSFFFSERRPLLELRFQLSSTTFISHYEFTCDPPTCGDDGIQFGNDDQNYIILFSSLGINTVSMHARDLCGLRSDPVNITVDIQFPTTAPTTATQPPPPPSPSSPSGALLGTSIVPVIIGVVLFLLILAAIISLVVIFWVVRKKKTVEVFEPFIGDADDNKKNIVAADHELPFSQFTDKKYQAYMSSLPPSALSHLDKLLDWDNKGVDKDLAEIAKYMLNWEEKLSILFELEANEIIDLKAVYRDDPPLLRKAVLQKWKDKRNLDATYSNLLKVFIEAGHTQCADVVYEVLKKKGTSICK